MADISSPYRLSGRIVDPSLNRITSGTETVQVEPKVMLVLTMLAERPGQVVTRDELMQRVWQGVFVTDDALHRAIRELRRLFGDDSEAPHVIETIRKRGYRLIAPVTPLDGVSARDESRSVHSAGDSRNPALRARRNPVLIALGATAIGAIAAFVWLGLGRSPHDADLRVHFMPLTSEPGNEIDPALSPTGRLAYVARGDDGRAHVFTKGSTDALATQVTRGEGVDHAPAWSPDETQLAFVRIDNGRCGIWIAASDGREARTLARCTAANEFRMSWSPDGNLLAVTAGGTTLRAPSHIEVISLADGRHRAITDPPPAHYGDWSPAFSPDGRTIAFIRSISGSISDVFVTRVDGGTARRITTDNADVLGVDWEGDGTHLVYSSDRAGGISVWRIAAAGGEPSLLAGGGAKLKHPTVARRAGIIAYEDWQYEINLREQATADEEGASTPISPTGDRWNFHPQISPDGKSIAFQSTRSGSYELWLSDRDGSHARPLTRSTIYKSPARWSPDSRRLVFTTRATGRTDISVLNVEDAAVRTVATDTSSAVAPSWSADGKSIYFGSLRTGSWQIWNVDVESLRPRRVTSDGGYAAVESADGRLLYVTRLDRRGLYRRPVEGGPDTLVAENVLAEQWPNWGVFDGGIYYVTWPDDGDPCLAFVSAPMAAPQLLARLPEYAWTGIALSRDGSRVLYAHADRRAANIGAVRIGE